MDEARYLEVCELLAKVGLSEAEAADMFGVWEPGDGALVLLRAAAMGLPLRPQQPIYPRLLEQARQLAAAGSKPSTPEEAVASQLLERADDTVVCALNKKLVGALELLAVQPWRWRRQFLAPVRLNGPKVVLEWDARGQMAGQRVLAVAALGRGEAFSLRLVIDDGVRQRPLQLAPEKAEINPDRLRSLPAEDVAAEAAALLACGLPHDAATKPIWWLVQIALLALAQADLGRV
jgi:hypothetical protein